MNSLSEIHQESIALIDQYFQHSPKPELFQEGLTAAKAFAISAHQHREWSTLADQSFRNSVLPLIALHFSDLFKNPAHQALLKKLQMVASRVFVFHLIAGKMRASPVDETLNSLFSSMYVIYDTLFDDQNYFDIEKSGSFESLQAIPSESDTISTEWPLVELFHAVNRKVFELLPSENSKTFGEIFEKLHEIQFESAFFKEKDLDLKKLKANTYLKGGYATQLSALLSPKAFTKNELDAFLLLGAPIQLADDLGDLLEDQRSGLQTLASLKAVDPLQVWSMYREVFHTFSALAQSQNYDSEYFEMFHGMVSFYIAKNLDIYFKSADLEE